MSVEVDNIIGIAQKPPLQDGAVHVCGVVSTVLPHMTHAVENVSDDAGGAAFQCFSSSWFSRTDQGPPATLCVVALMLTELPGLTGEAYRFHLPNSSSQYQSHSVARLKSGSSSELQVEILRTSWSLQVILSKLTCGLLELHGRDGLGLF